MESGDSTLTKEYFDKLLQELTRLNNLRVKDPSILPKAMNLLNAEVQRVWNELYGKEDSEDDTTTLTEKIPIPEVPDGKDDKGKKCNLVGRIIGPNGMSLRRLQAETGCQIVIRGHGSIKDPVKQERLRGTAGYEHLSEPLHVVITATGSKAEEKLKLGREVIQQLLRPCHDEYKRLQLAQLAIINGTYRPTRRH